MNTEKKELDIKDYLHLYLGVDFQTSNSWGNLNPTTLPAILTYMPEYREFKIILRRLSSMTEEERKELWRLVFSQGHGKNLSEAAKNFTGRVVFIDEKTYYQVPRHVMMQGVERLAIESDGTIWADCDLHNWRHNQHEVTRWFLSKGFDLFNLIDANLAIEKV